MGGGEWGVGWVRGWRGTEGAVDLGALSTESINFSYSENIWG